jgi:integrase/recombinase XerD
MEVSTPTPSAAISPLRQRTLKDTRMRQFAEHTQAGDIRAVRKLTTLLGRSAARRTPPPPPPPPRNCAAS